MFIWISIYWSHLNSYIYNYLLGHHHHYDPHHHHHYDHYGHHWVSIDKYMKCVNKWKNK